MADFNCRVFGVVVNDEEKILLLKRSQDYLPGDPNYCGWEIVGGGLEHGEDPKEAIVREYREEAGIEIEVARLYQARTGERDGKPLLNIGYICRHKSGDVRLTHEHTDFKWVTRDELKIIDFGPYSKKDIALYLSINA